MRFLPPRRWFQFHLSTWFVLVGILAWAMMCRPYFGRTLITASALASDPFAGGNLVITKQIGGTANAADFMKAVRGITQDG